MMTRSPGCWARDSDALQVCLQMSRRKGRSLLGWLFDTAEAPPATSLTSDTVVRIAAASPSVRKLGRDLPIATAHIQGERVVWVVTSAGVGAQWWVEVDDETGQIGEVHHSSGR